MAKGDSLEMVRHPDGEVAHLVVPPDGTYNGTWTAYRVEFTADKKVYHARMTDTGVRGTCACVVKVSGGTIRVRQ